MFNAIDRASEAALRDQVDVDGLRTHTEAFADLRRYPGSDDQWEAAEYIVETLEGWGVDAELQTFEAYTSVPEDATVTVTAPERRVFDDAITTAFSASTPDAGVSGPVTFIEDWGAALPDLTGQVALTRGLPTPAAVQPIEDAGADAVVFVSPNPEHLHEMIVSPIWGTPGIENRDALPDIPVAEVQQADGDWLVDRVAGEAVEVTVRTQTTTGLTELPCPVGRVDGTESDRYFLVGNHIDGWHEGVTDNATAMVATMELARLFAADPPKRGVIFGFWPGHSMGRYAGSAWYADENWLDLHENGVAYLHIDLNGLAGADQIWFQHMAEVGDEHRDVLEGASLPLGTAEGGGDLLGTTDRPGRNSDQSFWGAGLSSLLSGARFSADHEDAGPVGGGWWWHTPADTLDKVDFDLLAEETELYVAIVSRFCNSPVLPRDYRATVADIRTTLAAIEGDAGDAVDFAEAYDRLDALADTLEAVAAEVDRIDPDAPVDAAVEDLQVALGNRLIPALYMAAPAYEQEPALPHELLPYLRVAADLPELSGATRRFAETDVRRGLTKLTHQLAEANAAAERFLAARD